MSREAGFYPVELERCPHCRLRPLDEGGPSALRLAAQRAQEARLELSAESRASRLVRAARALRRVFRRPLGGR